MLGNDVKTRSAVSPGISGFISIQTIINTILSLKIFNF